MEKATKADQNAKKAIEKTHELEIKTDITDDTAETALVTAQLNSIKKTQRADPGTEDKLQKLAEEFGRLESIADEKERVKGKRELTRTIAELIIRNNLSKEKLITINKADGMIAAVASAIQIKPEDGDVKLLNQMVRYAKSPFTKHGILNAYRSYARLYPIDAPELEAIKQTIQAYRVGADQPLLNKIEHLIATLKIQGIIL